MGLLWLLLVVVHDEFMGLVVVDLWVFGCWRWWWCVYGVGEVADFSFFFGDCWGVCGGEVVGD